ncbi:MAG: hypothetical protein JST01_28535 [Cyanobacteria bacterium SZAS TMP-1]|nr:hypothetical protein [Cyanobacteria bacterium SZAS TMP-1]
MQTATIVAPKVSRNLTSSMVAIGSYSPSSAAIVTGLYLTNKTGASVTVRVSVWDGSNDTYICYDTPIGANDTLNVLQNGKLDLVSTWNVRASCATGSAVDAVMCVTEVA